MTKYTITITRTKGKFKFTQVEDFDNENDFLNRYFEYCDYHYDCHDSGNRAWVNIVEVA